ncbi:MAG: chemotaxis protein CheW [Chromatiaceae bacterium]|jgi:chemotaxis signal transduction protein|nr:chemotaxis protein CheW [Chromatiaceae bacterium]
MSAAPVRPSRLAAHDNALHGLLESLLAELPEEVEALPAAAQPALATVHAPAPGPGGVAAVPLNDQAARPLTAQVSPPSTPADPAVPAWGAQGFRALLFRIGAYRFAMPLVLLRSIAPLAERLTGVAGRPAWQLGLLRYRGRPVLVTDLGPLLGIQARCAAPRYLLVIGDGRTAVACDQIEQAVVVGTGDVRWRAAAAGRAVWLAGLLLRQMCAVLDADVIDERIRHG